MEIKERLTLSARPGKLTLIRTGMFLKFYQQSLFSLAQTLWCFYAADDVTGFGREADHALAGLVYAS
ncbi:hypothetical protein ACE2MH_004456 [Salmonella enterica]|nr:hypothetical protein [Salmonella enterica]